MLLKELIPINSNRTDASGKESAERSLHKEDRKLNEPEILILFQKLVHLVLMEGGDLIIF